jgi:hypothetical protein
MQCEGKMDKNAEVLTVVAVLVLVALAAFAAYRWQQRTRVRRVKDWVKEFLVARYGDLPIHLNINCSDDLLWPVFVTFNEPRSGILHRLQFACGGQQSSFSVLSEKEEKR